jgi:hypothetical protein
LEERAVAAHAVIADEGVRQGDLQRVPGVELAGDVRRRVGDDEPRPRVVRLGVVETFVLPGALPAFLDAFGLP